VNLLDTRLEKVGTMSWHQVDITEKEYAEVVEKFGGRYRGRTYGPLIKSPDEDLSQDTQQEQSSAECEDS
jgi:hypothetical protein